jgi:hypothetical protein
VLPFVPGLRGRTRLQLKGTGPSGDSVSRGSYRIFSVFPYGVPAVFVEHLKFREERPETIAQPTFVTLETPNEPKVSKPPVVSEPRLGNGSKSVGVDG